MAPIGGLEEDEPVSEGLEDVEVLDEVLVDGVLEVLVLVDVVEVVDASVGDGRIISVPANCCLSQLKMVYTFAGSVLVAHRKVTQ